MAGKKEIKHVPTEEQPYEIPENWCWTTIGTLADVKGGKRLPKGKALIDSRTDHPYIRVTDFKEQSINLSKVKFIDEETFYEIKNYTISNRDIYVSIAGSIGKVGIIPDELDGANLTENAAKITSIRCVNQKYLLHALMTEMAQEQMSNATVSTTQAKLALCRIETVCIPLAPAAEQERIVTAITELFADLDKAAENAQTIIDGYEIRKTAILYQAFNGDLTEEWRKANGVSEQWDDCVLLDVLKDKPRNGYSPQPVNYPTKYKSMTLSATTSGTFAPEHFKYIDEEIPEGSHLWMAPGDILIQRANSLEKVGTSAIYTEGYHEFIYPDLMMKLQVKDGVSAEFIAYQLKTQTVLTYFRSNATGTAGNMPKINQQVVSSAPMRIPSLAEQQEIVRILDELLGNEQRIKEAAEEMLDKIAMMKKSILADAFRGKLGTNDPADEPATELLRQILA